MISSPVCGLALGRAGGVGADGRLTGVFLFFIARWALLGREEEISRANACVGFSGGTSSRFADCDDDWIRSKFLLLATARHAPVMALTNWNQPGNHDDRKEGFIKLQAYLCDA